MLDIEAIWKGWQAVATWFTVLNACALGAVLAERPDAAIALAVMGVGVVMLGIGRTLLHILEVLWLRKPE
ncbi:MAG: hypothetical protein ACI841_002881 [Planctomycetota bacterium]|jgi:hypothetical protein